MTCTARRSVLPMVSAAILGAASVAAAQAPMVPPPRDSVIAVDTADDAASANLRAFYARERAGGMGYYIDEQRMDALQPATASEALRVVPGVVLVHPARALGTQVRIRGCAPLIWIDGQRVVGAELDEVARAADVAAMEVYSSQAGVPAAYADRTATCGTILVWSRPD